mmetsp:Transcript_25822/g.56117  ORF Transcript_25822/g.56117 Transcript_25822/m.56117 type:complete len:132 (+) Transcript_25822:1149-1544(+)
MGLQPVDQELQSLALDMVSTALEIQTCRYDSPAAGSAKPFHLESSLNMRLVPLTLDPQAPRRLQQRLLGIYQQGPSLKRTICMQSLEKKSFATGEFRPQRESMALRNFLVKRSGEAISPKNFALVKPTLSS